MHPVVLVVLMALIMYFLVLRPQNQERRTHQAMIGSLKKGDRIITIGGVFGTVAAVHEHDLVLKIDEKNNTRVRILKTAIHQRVSGEAGDADAEPAMASKEASKE